MAVGAVPAPDRLPGTRASSVTGLDVEEGSLPNDLGEDGAVAVPYTVRDEDLEHEQKIELLYAVRVTYSDRRPPIVKIGTAWRRPSVPPLSDTSGGTRGNAAGLCIRPRTRKLDDGGVIRRESKTKKGPASACAGRA